MESTRRVPSLYEGINARNLPPRQVAKTFVVHQRFGDLASVGHHILVGPRGSGKTTMLKMLTPQALESWQGDAGDYYRTAIPYSGVFVGADRVWTEAQSLVGGIGVTERTRALLARAALTTLVLHSLVDVMHYRAHSDGDPRLRPFRRARLDKSDEVAVVRHLSEAWRLRPAVPTLLSLKQSLTVRQSVIGELADIAGDRGLDQTPPFLHMNVLQAVVIGVEAFNDAAGEPYARWALLFDELELASSALRLELMSALRSRDQRLLFKLSLSPFAPELGIGPGARRPELLQDYRMVSLTYPHKEEGYEFSRSLFMSLVERRAPNVTKAEDVLGWSTLDTSPRDWVRDGNAYGADHTVARRYRDLYAADATFRTWMKSHGIDVMQLDRETGADRAALIRKVASLVAVRLAFRKPDLPPAGRRRTAGDGATDLEPRGVRGRKSYALYSGASALFALTEGNPRLMIGIASPLIEVFVGVRKATSPVPPPAQAARVLATSNAFLALLRTLVPEARPTAGVHRSVLEVLDPIGRYFFDRAVRDPFNPDPAGSFVVDAGVSPDTVAVLALALNAGAIMHVPERSSSRPDMDVPVMESLYGRRFRLSFVIAPHYQLPLVVRHAVSLSHVFRATGTPMPMFTEHE